MNFKRKRPLSLQRGFTLIEALVVLTILTIMGLLAANSFDGARTKAQAMVSLGKQIGESNIQLKLDTGCYVNKPKALFDPTYAQDVNNNYCKRPFGTSWARAYMAKYPVDSSGSIVFDKIGAGVTASFPTTPEAGGLGRRYYVRFSNVPKDIIRQALNECNADPVSLGDFTDDKCRTTSDMSTDTPGTFDYLFDETR